MTVVADRGFGYMELFERLEQELGFAYIIRFKGNILVGYSGGEQVPARDWLTPTGRTRNPQARWSSLGNDSLSSGSIVVTRVA